MAETRKIAAILAADVVGSSRMASADEDRTLARLRALCADLIDPTVASQNGRVFKRSGDGAMVEFRSVVEAVRCAITIQNAMIERNIGMSADQRIDFRIGIHLGDVVEESDGDLMGDGVNIAARLEGVAAPGAIFLSEDAYRQVRDKLKHEFVDLGEKALKNIARPMRVYAVGTGVQSSAHARSATAPEGQGPPHLSIVVLPFANLGGDPEQEYFIDGVTESLTTDLSRIHGSFVISRNTAFTYKGKPFDVKQIGRELNVRYALEGSVQRGGNRVRVNVQLVSAESGNHVWAERFDKALADFFDMQDEIIARLANAVSSQLFVAEARRAERTLNPDALDLCFQGLAWYNKGMRPEYLARAREFCERALALDPVNALALTCVALVDLSIALNLFPEDRAALLTAAEAMLTKVLSLGPETAQAHVTARAHMILGVVQMHTSRVAQGIRACTRALQLDQNLASAHAQIGNGKLLLGLAEDTEAHIQEALRLIPSPQKLYPWAHRRVPIDMISHGH